MSSGFSSRQNPVDDLPLDISGAASRNEIVKVMDWLGPTPKARRLNAKCCEKLRRTLLHEAVTKNDVPLMRLLLQLGAVVDSRNGSGMTPLLLAVQRPGCEEAVRLLMEWGADCPQRDMNSPSDLARYDGHNPDLADLLATPLGGRRCEIQGLQGRAELNDTCGVVMAYLPAKDRYRIVLERTKETVNIRPSKLKRFDRTPTEEGFYLVYRKGPSGKEDDFQLSEKWKRAR